MRVGGRPERLLRSLGRCVAAHVCLEVAPPVARALAPPAVVDDDDVAELGALAVPAAEGLAAGDDPAADSGPEREHHEVVDAAPCARTPLPDRGGVRVILQADRLAEALMHVIPQRRVLEREVDAVDDDAPRRVDRRRRPEANPAHRVV